MYVKVATSDNVVFEVDRKVIRQSEVVRQALARRRCKTVGEGEPIRLERVNSTIFRKVLYWCTYHRDDDDENKRRRMYDVASWEREFFRAGKSSLLDLLLAATYLAFVHFRDVCSRVLSDTPMRGTHPEVRGALNAYSEENQSTSNY